MIFDHNCPEVEIFFSALPPASHYCMQRRNALLIGLIIGVVLRVSDALRKLVLIISHIERPHRGVNVILSAPHLCTDGAYNCRVLLTNASIIIHIRNFLRSMCPTYSTRPQWLIPCHIDSTLVARDNTSFSGALPSPLSFNVCALQYAKEVSGIVHSLCSPIAATHPICLLCQCKLWVSVGIGMSKKKLPIGLVVYRVRCAHTSDYTYL